MNNEPTPDKPSETPPALPENIVSNPAPAQDAAKQQPLPDSNKAQHTNYKKKKDAPVELIKEPITLAVLIQQLLRSPLNVVHSLHRDAKVPWAPLLLFTIAAYALFGLILGMFSAGDQLWAAPVKVAGGILFASLICLPSLFIFTSLCRVETKFRVVIGVLICSICITALLLLGFIPILWLFSTTSSSIGFFGFLALATWIICLCIGLSFIRKSVKHLGATSTGPLELWFIIFGLVTLQMPTTLRPIIGKSEESFINFDEKKFFLYHWAQSLDPYSEEKIHDCSEERQKQEGSNQGDSNQGDSNQGDSNQGRNTEEEDDY